jgi:aminoglycoside phosphotransferase (APT) family kinase protein
MLVPVAMHPRRLAVEVETVRVLVAEQFPSWGALPIRPVVSQGTVNAIFRVGDALPARFPLQRDDPAETLRQLVAEAAAASELVGRTGFPTPEPVAL